MKIVQQCRPVNDVVCNRDDGKERLNEVMKKVAMRKIDRPTVVRWTDRLRRSWEERR